MGLFISDWDSVNPMSDSFGHLFALIYGVPFVWIGIKHFLDPDWFEPIVPEILGNARFWVYASGAFEILLGIGIIPHSGIPGPPTGPTFLSTSIWFSETSKSSESIILFISG